MDLSCADTTLSTSMFMRLNSSKHPLGDGGWVKREERVRRRGGGDRREEIERRRLGGTGDRWKEEEGEDDEDYDDGDQEE